MMRQHSKIQTLLYGYLHSELKPNEIRMVEVHLSSCRECAAELEALRKTLDVLRDQINMPSEERSMEYWQKFAQEVDKKIQSIERTVIKPKLLTWDSIVSFFSLRQRFMVTISSTVAVIILAAILWKSNFFSKQDNEVNKLAQQSTRLPNTNQRIEQYFRRSRVLLVGITNLKLENDQPLDLGPERKVSRELVHEARYLKKQPLDLRSAQLINNMENILIELANMKEENGIPGVEIIRSGIHQENLLFKVRMAEARYDTAQYLTVNHHF